MCSLGFILKKSPCKTMLNSALPSRALPSCSPIPLDSNSKFFKSYFYRTLHIWNKLPIHIRQICTLVKFKLEVRNFLWNQLLSNNSLELG